MNALAICTTHNKIGRRDGDEFLRECNRFTQLFDASVLHYRDQWSGKRRRLAEQFLRSAGKLSGPADVVAIFGHGGKRKLYCTGHAIRHIPALADALKVCLNPQASTVVLYCCLTGKGFGFADRLDLALEARGINVKTVAHTTKGHVSWNPATEESGEGPKSCGVELIPRGHPLRKEWIRRLREDQDFRLSFWAMTQTQLEVELGGVAPMTLPEDVKNQL